MCRALETMTLRVSSARALAPLLVLVSSLSTSRAFCGIVSTRPPSSTRRWEAPRNGRSSSSGISRTSTASGRFGSWFPHAPTNVLQSTADDDGQEGGAGGGEGEGSGMFGGLQEWWERDGKEDLKIYSISLALALTVRTVALEPRFIPSLSMYPTFEIGDQLAVDKLSVKFSRQYQRKDVVVFHPPPKFSEFSDRGPDEALIKRVIAVDGDRVEIKDGSLFINGEQQFEDYTFEEPEYKWGPQTVPEGMVMVLGDNRNHSLDSHIWGFLPKENVIGRAVFKYWPPWRVGLVEV